MLLLRQRRYVLGQVWSKMLTKNSPQWRRNGVLPSQPSMPCSGAPAPTLPPPVKQSLLRRIFFSQKPKSRVPWFKWGLFAGVGSAMFGMYSVRKYRDSLVMDLNKPVHLDNSVVSIATVKRQVVPTVKFVKIETKDQTSASLVDEQKYSEFVKRSVEALVAAQKEFEEESSKLLSEKVNKCFNEIHPRSEQFADWYFSYSTSFKLIQEATMSMARHTAKVFENTPINEAVAADMDKFMTQKYERIVLRPEISNSELTSAYYHCVKEIHSRQEQINYM